MSAKKERARDRALAQRIQGRTIVGAFPHAGWDSKNKAFRRWVHNWELYLDDGSILRFVTEETEHGADYGTDILIHEPGSITVEVKP